MKLEVYRHFFLTRRQEISNILNFVSYRPPLNLLRQELSGTTIYLEILHKSTVEHDANESSEEANGFSVEQEKLKNLAEGKLVSFCGQILKEASELQPSNGETASADIHRVLDLRAPVIVMVY